MRHNRFRRQRKPIVLPEVSLTPLIDTALTLLIIFMITTPMMNNTIKVDLPSSHVDETESRQDHEETIVYVDKKNKFYLNGKEMDLPIIVNSLRKMAELKKIEMVFVKADQAVEYGKVIDVVDTIKTAGGIKYVALATKRAV